MALTSHFVCQHGASVQTRSRSAAAATITTPRESFAPSLRNAGAANEQTHSKPVYVGTRLQPPALSSSPLAVSFFRRRSISFFRASCLQAGPRHLRRAGPDTCAVPYNRRRQSTFVKLKVPVSLYVFYFLGRFEGRVNTACIVRCAGLPLERRRFCVLALRSFRSFFARGKTAVNRRESLWLRMMCVADEDAS